MGLPALDTSGQQCRQSFQRATLFKPLMPLVMLPPCHEMCMASGSLKDGLASTRYEWPTVPTVLPTCDFVQAIDAAGHAATLPRNVYGERLIKRWACQHSIRVANSADSPSNVRLCSSD